MDPHITAFVLPSTKWTALTMPRMPICTRGTPPCSPVAFVSEKKNSVNAIKLARIICMKTVVTEFPTAGTV